MLRQEPELSYRIHVKETMVSILIQINRAQTHKCYFFKTDYILDYPSIHLGLQNSPFLKDFQLKFCMYFSPYGFRPNYSPTYSYIVNPAVLINYITHPMERSTQLSEITYLIVVYLKKLSEECTMQYAAVR